MQQRLVSGAGHGRQYRNRVLRVEMSKDGVETTYRSGGLASIIAPVDGSLWLMRSILVGAGLH